MLEKAYLVAHPIEGLHVESQIQIADVRIMPGGRGANPWREAIANAENSIDVFSKHKEWFISNANDNLKKVILDKGKSYTLTRVVAEQKRALGEAFKRANTALDVLRLMQYWYGKHGADIAAFAIYGPAHSQEINSLAMSEGGVLTLGWERKGPFIYQTFERDQIIKMKSWRPFKSICTILKKDETTQMEEKLLDAISWFGSSTIEYIDHLKFLKIVISIESLLSTKNDDREGRISANIGERIAFLLTSRRNEISRYGYVKEWKEIYNLRSRIVHEGETLVSRNILRAAERLAAESIVKIVGRSDIKTVDDLLEWHKEMRLR